MRDDSGVELQVKLGKLDAGLAQMRCQQRRKFVAKAADRNAELERDREVIAHASDAAQGLGLAEGLSEVRLEKSADFSL